MSRESILSALTAVVQYRRREEGVWHTMAAFDSLSIAEIYAKDCAGTSPERPWEYQAVEIPEEESSS